MKQYQVSVVRADESYGYAMISYSVASTVTVEIMSLNSAGSRWRIRGRASLGDNNTYLEGIGFGTYTFESSNNKSYIFQIQNWNNDWVNTTNMYGEQEENSIFNVVFESGSGDSGGGSGGEVVGEHKLHINEGKGTKITVKRTWSDFGDYGNVYLSDGDTIYYPADRFQITAEALPGYKINYYTSSDGEYLPFMISNLTKPYAGEPYQLSINSDATVTATAIRTTNIRIDDGTNFDNKYYCYIDTEYVEDPTKDLNCTIIGQRSGYYVQDIGKMSWYATFNESYTMDNESRWGACYISKDEYMVYFLKFITPNFYSVSEELKIEIKMRNNSNYSESNQTVRYALCTSDENYHLYLDTVDPVSDPYQIETGTFQEINGDDKISTISIKTDKLKGNTTYYLLVWDAYKSSKSSGQIYVKPAINHTITLKRDSSNGSFYYTKFDLYIPYIDNGTSWEQL